MKNIKKSILFCLLLTSAFNNTSHAIITELEIKLQEKTKLYNDTFYSLGKLFSLGLLGGLTGGLIDAKRPSLHYISDIKKEEFFTTKGFFTKNRDKEIVTTTTRKRLFEAGLQTKYSIWAIFAAIIIPKIVTKYNERTSLSKEISDLEAQIKKLKK